MAVGRMLVAGRYRLHEPVGTGGMGRVWLARDETLDRDVAVKEFVPPDWMTDEEKARLKDRTLREARSAARLNHPHVVQIYDVVHADGQPWIVMEYVPSRSLHQVLNEDGPFPPAEAARIGLAVLDALAAAHRAGVLHRDVKPHNVLIGTNGRVVLTDFGLATFADDGGVTGPGLIVGSPQYVSPERARDGASTVEADLWSFGATLYAAVEGRSPYARDSAMATLMALATEPPDPPRLAGELEPVLTGLLRHDPAARLTTAEVERRLRMVVAANSSHAGAVVGLPSPRRSRDNAGRAEVAVASRLRAERPAPPAAPGRPWDASGGAGPEAPGRPWDASDGAGPEVAVNGAPAAGLPGLPAGGMADEFGSDVPATSAHRPAAPSSEPPAVRRGERLAVPAGDRPAMSGAERPGMAAERLAMPVGERPGMSGADRTAMPFGDRPAPSAADRPAGMWSGGLRGTRAGAPSDDQPDRPTIRRLPTQRGPAATASEAAADRPQPPPPVWIRPARAVAAAAVVAALAFGGILAAHLVEGDERQATGVRSAPADAGLPSGATGGSAPANATTGNATGSSTTGSFAAVACNGPAPADAPTAPQRNAARGVSGWSLVNGWSYFTDNAGFHMPVPDGWSYQKIGTTYCFRDPVGERVLSLDIGRNPTGDPVTACRAEAARLVRAGALPNYQLLALEPRPLLHKAADWEYRYDDPQGVPLHARTRWFATNGKAYAISWATREIDWTGDLPKLDMVLSTFYADGKA